MRLPTKLQVLLQAARGRGAQEELVGKPLVERAHCRRVAAEDAPSEGVYLVDGQAARAAKHFEQRFFEG